MQAIILDQHGTPDVLRLVDVPDPQPRPDETLVELRASAVNRRDLLLRAGATPPYRPPLPLILGSDGAGVRRDSGEPVVLLPSLDWGPSQAVAGPDLRILGGPGDGTYAELIAVPTANLFPRPPHLSWEQAAALPLAALTAYRALFVVAELRRDETLVVLGAGGGVGLAATQLAVVAGARVAATSSSADKRRIASELGAVVTADYRDPDWTAEIRDRLGPADVVLDSSGADWSSALSLLGAGGRLVSCGSTCQAEAAVDIRSLYVRQQSIRGSLVGSPRDFAALLRIVDKHRLVPVIDAVSPLSEAAAAHRRMERGQHCGKLVLRIDR